MEGEKRTGGILGRQDAQENGKEIVQNALSQESLSGFEQHLREQEKSEGTIEKYMRDISELAGWLAERKITKENLLCWRAHLLEKKQSAQTVNAKLSAVNGFLKYIGLENCRVRFLKVQRRLFRAREKELTQKEYERLLHTAQSQGRERLWLIMETICGSGIRVSELKYIIVEAAQAGRAEVALKGKVRSILLPGKLRKKLLKYAKEQGITSGVIFRTRNGNPISRRQIWSEMKSLCDAAKVARTKVFPHNLRHLFAVTFYRVCRDVVKLADVLGHSSIETTRIYLVSAGDEHARLLDRMQLVS